MTTRGAWWLVAGVLLALLLVGGLMAPEHLPSIDPSQANLGPAAYPPFGTGPRGRPLWDVALQGAGIIVLPALAAAVVVACAGALAGLVRSAGLSRIDAVMGATGELVGALPRWVVILVVAVLTPWDARSLWPIALTWALLAAPAAMDEAAATAERMGGTRFVEALRAHGFGAWRIFGIHVLGYNLRPVLVRQGAEVLRHVAFLEIALSYLAVSQNDPALTHPDSSKSWADILYYGYTALLGEPQVHALVLGLALVGMMALTSFALTRATAAR